MDFEKYRFPFPGMTADDWGLSKGVNQGILDLAQKRIVKRVSILANGAYVTHLLTELLSIEGIEVQLHFNLTYGEPLVSGSQHLIDSRGRFLSLPQVLKRSLGSLFGGASLKAWQTEILAEFRAQLAKLRAQGLDVRAIDGHQHVHIFPAILEAIGPALKSEGIEYVRLPLDPGLIISKKFPITVFSLRARSLIAKFGCETKPFSYPSLDIYQKHDRLKQHLLKHMGSEILCHPAQFNDLESLTYPDSYRSERVLEYEGLNRLA